MSRRSAYNTKQRSLIHSILAAHADSFLTVDEIHAEILSLGSQVGRTTVYRTLESLVAEGAMAKVADVRGGAARYRLLEDGVFDGVGAQASNDLGNGQLRCISCGRVTPLDCDMLGDFFRHVEDDHGFCVDSRRTVLYGECTDCRNEKGVGTGGRNGE